MNIFVLLNFIKLIIWVIIVYLTCNYIDLSKDFVVWVFSMWIWGFIIIWSLSFFILLWILKITTKKKFSELWMTAYKYTGLIASFILTNFLLMSFDFWSKTIAFFLLICFVILWMII